FVEKLAVTRSRIQSMDAEFAERDVTAAIAADQFSKAEEVASGLPVAIDCVLLFFSGKQSECVGIANSLKFWMISFGLEDDKRGSPITLKIN
ncbi:hypothetical protein Tco_1494395, partial [Tanacetum coccineum]